MAVQGRKGKTFLPPPLGTNGGLVRHSGHLTGTAAPARHGGPLTGTAAPARHIGPLTGMVAALTG